MQNLDPLQSRIYELLAPWAPAELAATDPTVADPAFLPILTGMYPLVHLLSQKHWKCLALLTRFSVSQHCSVDPLHVRWQRRGAGRPSGGGSHHWLNYGLENYLYTNGARN